MTQNWTVTRDLFLTQEEVQRLYQVLRDAKDLALQRKAFYCHVRDYYILRTLLESGLRVAELAALKVGNVRDGALIVERGKGGKRRTVLLTKPTQKLLAEFLRVKKRSLGEPVRENAPFFLSERRKPYSTRGIRKRVKVWFREVGISENLSCHSCRHSYVSHMIAAGVDLPTVRDNAGHSSLAITSIYAHAVRGDLGELQLYSS